MCHVELNTRLSFNIWAMLLNVTSLALIQVMSAIAVKSTVSRGNNLKTTNGKGKGKGGVPVTGPVVAQRVGRGTALLFHNHGTRRGEWSAARPGRTLPPGRTRYPF